MCSFRSHIGFLEGLRGLAVIFVLLSHADNAGYRILPFADFGGSGKIGVWLFFVLSAFLLTGIMRASPDALSLRGVAQYLVGRIFRIFPLFVVIVVLFAAFSVNGFAWDDVVPHLMLVDGKHLFWAVPVEFGYYLALPFVFFLFRRLGRMTHIVAAALVVSAVAAYFFPVMQAGGNSIALPVYIAIFLCGTVAAMAVAEREPGPRAGALAVAALILIFASLPKTVNAVLPLFQAPVMPIPFFHAFGPAYAMLWSVVILGCIGSAPVAKLFDNRVMRFCGRVSFSLYLVHWPILTWLGGLQGLPAAYKGYAMLLLSLVASVLTYCALERPGMRLGRRLRDRILLGAAR